MPALFAARGRAGPFPDRSVEAIGLCSVKRSWPPDIPAPRPVASNDAPTATDASHTTVAAEYKKRKNQPTFQHTSRSSPTTGARFQRKDSDADDAPSKRRPAAASQEQTPR